MTSTEFPCVNRVVIVGRLVRDPELRRTSAGVPVSNFKIASRKQFCDESNTPREEVCYVGIAAWQYLAEECYQALGKGSVVRVEGELKSRVRDNGKGIKRSFVEVRAHTVELWQGGEEFSALAGHESSGEPEYELVASAESLPTDCVADEPVAAIVATEQHSTRNDEYHAEPEEL